MIRDNIYDWESTVCTVNHSQMCYQQRNRRHAIAINFFQINNSKSVNLIAHYIEI